MRRLIFINGLLITGYLLIPQIITQEQTITKVNIADSIKVSRHIEHVMQVKRYELTTTTDLTISCNLTAEDYEVLLPKNLKGLGQALVEADSKVNGLYMLGLICLESGYGTSSFAINRNNLVGWNANDSNPNGASYFNSKAECIKIVTDKLKKNYLTESDVYYNGVTPRAVDVRYCSDKQHADKIVAIVSKLVKGVR